MARRLLVPLPLLAACSEYALGTPAHEQGGEPAPMAWGGEWVVETWDLPEQAGTDLLFFGDTSGSMTEELALMGSLVTSFVARLEQASDLWQLLVVTGPDGCGINGVLDQETADYASLFAQAIVTPPGEDDVDEWGLYNAAQAVENTDAGECNEGFLRDDAMLHVIFISDEDDNSPGWDGGDAAYWQTYVDTILAKRGDAARVMFSAVAGPVPKGCTGAEPGYGYADAVDATGGSFLSICEDWPSQLDVLADSSVTHTDFELERLPDPETIAVAVEGQPREDGWAYVADGNLVRFSVDAPGPGDSVQITYLPID